MNEEVGGLYWKWKNTRGEVLMGRNLDNFKEGSWKVLIFLQPMDWKARDVFRGFELLKLFFYILFLVNELKNL